VTDPHEIANVLGVAGVEYMLAASKGVPLGVYVMMPSCVPASQFESPAGPLDAGDFPELLRRQRVIGIAELMNYPAAIAAEADIMSKMALTDYRRIDGHAPGVTGKALNAYIVSGPSSDHECTSLEEALEKKRLGLWIMIREASMIRNLIDLLPLVRDYGTENCMFVTDDREASTLVTEGHINSIVRKAVEHGLAAGDAVKLASLNVARYHGLDRLGAVAPGYAADVLVLPDLVSFEPGAVFKRGVLVAEDGSALPFQAPPVPRDVTGTVRVRPVSADDFRVAPVMNGPIRVVELVRDQVVTRAGTAVPRVEAGYLVADPDEDLVKLAVVERHRASGRIGLGFVRGFRLRRGAFASTVAHDAHNIVVAGVSDEDMARCVARLAEIGGGLVVCAGGQVLAELPLEIAGLMSTRSAPEVADDLEALERQLERLGVDIGTPFMYLGFLALSVIPELRVTDRGLVDVRTFELVPLGVE
jgi:adenine deaminase